MLSHINLICHGHLRLSFFIRILLAACLSTCIHLCPHLDHVMFVSNSLRFTEMLQ